jgi:hypothetical protein
VFYGANIPLYQLYFSVKRDFKGWYLKASSRDKPEKVATCFFKQGREEVDSRKASCAFGRIREYCVKDDKWDDDLSFSFSHVELAKGTRLGVIHKVIIGLQL